MNLLMMTFVICGLLTLVTKAGWSVERCWRYDIGHCRRRCLRLERYKFLCMNKLSCCIPLSSDDPYTQWPLTPEDLTLGMKTQDVGPVSPESDLNDQITITITTDQKSTVTEQDIVETAISFQVSTPFPENIEDMKLSDEPKTLDPHKF
uniref:Beta-defensin n=1 Tax=Catagonus wagneri TaxID=51154 RepID=A0A8C3WDP4_9CETA